MVQNIEEEIIQEFKRRVKTILGDRLDRIILFGSRSRGDAEEDSDFDFLVLVKSFADESKPSVRTIAHELSLRCDVVVTALVVTLDDFREDRYFYLYENIKNEGKVI